MAGDDAKRRSDRNDDNDRDRSFLLGVGLDDSDGHRRITRGDGFHLEGGSEETHERMQDTVIHVTERLSRKGRAIPTASAEELRDLVRDELDRQS